MQSFLLVFAVAVIGGMTPFVSKAQVVVMTQGAGARLPESRKPIGRPGTLITVRLDDVPLGQALQTIAKQADVKIVIAEPVLSLKHRVTINLTNVSGEQAFQAALKGSDVSMKIDRTGQIVFAKEIKKTSGTLDGVISGRVTDAKTGKGISGVRVSAGTDAAVVITGDDGSYRLTGINAGLRTVTVRLVGYAKQTKSVMLEDGATVTADFTIEPSANVLDQVVVTGSVVVTELKAIPSAITVVTAKQIEERGITRIDQLFRGDIPGLFSGSSGGANALNDVAFFYSRGATALSSSSAGVSPPSANSNPIKTYVDGVEMANPMYLNQIDPRSIERIEILTGPQASTIYGSNAINGVMQIFTKRGMSSTPQLTLNLLSGWVESSFSSAHTPQHDYSAQLSDVEGYLSYNVGGSWQHIGPWNPAIRQTVLGSFGGARATFPTRLGQLTADLTMRIASTRNRHSSGSYTSALTDLTDTGWYTPLNGFFMGRDYPQVNALDGRTTGITVGYAPRSWWSHEISIGSDVADVEVRATEPRHLYIFLGDTNLIYNRNSSERRSIRYTTTVTAQLANRAQASITLGADTWHSLESAMDASPMSLTGTILGVNFVTRQPSHNTGGFSQLQLGLLDKLFITYGVRLEWNPTYGDEVQPNVAPRYGVAYTTSFGPVTTKLRGSYGRSTRPPSVGQKDGTFRDVFDPLLEIYGRSLTTVPNPALGPEFQKGGEGGIEIYFGNRGSLVVTRYNQTVDALISYVGGVDSVKSLEPNPLFYGFLTCEDVIAFGTYICSSQDADGYTYAHIGQSRNLAVIRNQGWELQGSLSAGPFTTRGTYSLTKSRTIGVDPRYRSQFTNPYLTQYQPGASHKFFPEHTWALGVTYAKANTTVAVNLNGLGRITNIQDELYVRHLSESVRLDQNRFNFDLATSPSYISFNGGYATADINASHRFSDRIEGVTQILNLANNYENDVAAYSTTVGRQIKLGARIRTR